MKFKVLRLRAISAFFVALLAACSSGDPGNPGITTPWLGTLKGFERVSGEGEFGVFRSTSPGKTARFERAMIVPPEITVSARSDLDAMHPETYEKIKSAFHAALQNELAKKFPIVETASGATHQVHLALNGVTVTRTTNNSFAVRLDDLRFAFSGATIEAEFREVKSNARAAAIVLRASAGTIGWNALSDQLNEFAIQTAEQAAVAYKAINERADKPTEPAPTTPAKN